MRKQIEERSLPILEHAMVEPKFTFNQLNNQSYFTEKPIPFPSRNKMHQKDLSVRSVSTNKKPQFSRISQRSAFDMYYQETQISEQARSNYETIERILKSQNNNLKKQNELLLSQVYRLKNINKKYKDICHSQRLQLQGAKEECQVQKKRADQMKQLIMTRLQSLEHKALGEEQHSANSSLVEISGLSLTQSGVHEHQ